MWRAEAAEATTWANIESELGGNALAKRELNPKRRTVGFRGCWVTEVTAGGCLHVPNALRRVMSRISNKFYVTSLDGKWATLYPLVVWERIEEHLSRLSPENRTKQKFLTRTNLYGAKTTLNRSGLNLPTVLCESADLRGRDAVILWNGVYFSIYALRGLEGSIQ
jgi:DNA-binding transcriptional regulator/RsmH inhibitor MraZ